MARSVLRIALVGYGGVGRLHYRAYRGHPLFRVTSIVDPRADRLDMPTDNSDLLAFEDLDELFASGAADVACISTPTADHHRSAVRCMEAGLHVLCEKPFALRLEHADAMISAAKRFDVRLGYGASYRYLPALLRARELIRDGAIGRVTVVRELSIGGGGKSECRTLPAEHYPLGGPGGTPMGLVDHGIHLIDTIPWLIDSPIDRVFGFGNRSGESPGTECALLQLCNGVLGILLYNEATYSTTMPAEGIFSLGEGWSVDGLRQSGCWDKEPGVIHVHGSEGALRISHYANQLHWFSDGEVRQIPISEPPPPAHFGEQMASFVRAILDGTELPVPAEVGRTCLHALLKIYRSEEEQRWIDVDGSSRIH